jgi:hypothetical protein
MKPGVLRITTGQETRFEGYHHYLDNQSLKLPLVLLQLQQMPPARQSTQVPVKDHQEPATSVVIKTLELSERIDHLEGHGRLSHQIVRERIFLAHLTDISHLFGHLLTFPLAH